MKSLKYIIAGFCLAALPGMEAMAQEVVKVDDPWKDYPDKKTLYKDYSRWSIGVNIGMPFYAGDFRSVSRGNNNWAGYMFGLQGSYQFNPIFGARLSVDYGSNRAGSQRYEDDFVLLPNGNTYYNSGLSGRRKLLQGFVFFGSLMELRTERRGKPAEPLPPQRR